MDEPTRDYLEKALTDLYHANIAGAVYILQQPDGTFFHEILWNYPRWPYRSNAQYLKAMHPNSRIVYLGRLESMWYGGSGEGFRGFINRWGAANRQRLHEGSIVIEVQDLGKGRI